MYTDETLTPKEAIRLCALGTLALKSRTYGGLAGDIRHFVSRMMGPSLDVLGASVELLKYEGLIAPEDEGDDPLFAITEAGRDELRTLLVARVRSGALELNKLIVALKFHFLHLLEDADQRTQADLLLEVCESELTRLEDLRAHHADDAGYLVQWLDHDIAQSESRLVWLENFRRELGQELSQELGSGD